MHSGEIPFGVRLADARCCRVGEITPYFFLGELKINEPFFSGNALVSSQIDGQAREWRFCNL